MLYFNELKSRYDPDFVIAKLSSIEQGQQENLCQEFQEFQEKGNPPSKNDTKNDNRPPDFQDREAKKEEKNIPSFQNDGTLGTDGTELKNEPENSDVQNENSLWRVNPKKALFDPGIHLSKKVPCTHVIRHFFKEKNRFDLS